jgi:hypothetical protein
VSSLGKPPPIAGFYTAFTQQPVRNLEHDPEKWKPVFRKDHAQSKKPDRDAILSNRIMI